MRKAVSAIFTFNYCRCIWTVFAKELQSYFVKRIGDHLKSKFRILIEWDDIDDCGRLNSYEVLMSWRGWKAENIEKAA